jgi:hypothetical protein
MCPHGNERRHSSPDVDVQLGMSNWAEADHSDWCRVSFAEHCGTAGVPHLAPLTQLLAFTPLDHCCRAARCRRCCAACFWRMWRRATCGRCCRRRRAASPGTRRRPPSRRFSRRRAAGAPEVTLPQPRMLQLSALARPSAMTPASRAADRPCAARTAHPFVHSASHTHALGCSYACTCFLYSCNASSCDAGSQGGGGGSRKLPSAMVRLVDDFLLLTPSAAAATAVLRRALQGGTCKRRRGCPGTLRSCWPMRWELMLPSADPEGSNMASLFLFR